MGKLVTEHYWIDSRKLPREFDGVKIAYLSDLHNASFGKENKRLLRLLQQERPDYVFLGGDMLVGKKEFEAEVPLALCRQLCRRYPVYMGLGNHEQRLLEHEETRGSFRAAYIEEIRKLGVRILDNESVRLQRGSGTIRLYGLTMAYAYYGKKWKSIKMEASYLGGLLGECEQEEFSILLAHSPKYFKAYARWGADLVLSGHHHGGVVVLPGLGGVIAPDYALFPKYDFGYFQEGNSQMVLSRGLGSHTIKLRILNAPELSIITLGAASK